MFNIAFAPLEVGSVAVAVAATSGPGGVTDNSMPSNDPSGNDNGGMSSEPLNDECGKKKRSRRRRKPNKGRTGVGGAPNEEVAMMHLPMSTSSSRAGSTTSSKQSGRSNGTGKSGSRGKGGRSRRNNGASGGHAKAQSSKFPVGNSAGGATSKKQHDAPMTKRDLYFSLSTQAVEHPSEGPDGAPSKNTMFRVTVVNWDNQVVLDALVLSDGASLSPRPPVSSSKKSSAPTPMSFTQARNEVERILRGKILIGYNLEGHLKMLRLAHPWSDVRDAATYARLGGSSVSSTPRPLTELSLAVLQRELKPDESEPPLGAITSTSDLVALCVTSLDLYKALRKEWEQDLVHIAKEKEALQQEQLHQHQQRMVSQRQKAMADHFMRMQNHRSDISSPHNMQRNGQYYHHPYASQQHMLEVSSQISSSQMSSQRSRSSSYDAPFSPHHAGSHHDMVSPGHHHGFQPHHQPHLSSQHPPPQQQSSKSWFRRSQKLAQVSPTQQTPAVSNPSLSAQAIQALAGPEIHQPMSNRYVGAGSSAYDSSSQYGGSTDFDSYYSESMATESVASNDLMGSPSPFAQPPRHDSMGQDQHQSASPECSSWFRLGVRKTRFQTKIDTDGKESPPLLAVEESMDENHEETGFVTSSSDHNQSLSHKSSSKGSLIFDECQPPSKKSDGSKSWFGFRKSKSPAASKHLMNTDDVLVGLSGGASDVAPLPFPGAPESALSLSVHGNEAASLGKLPKSGSERSSSWFNFRRGKSPSSNKGGPQGNAKFSQEELLASSTLPTLSTQVTDDDWMKEVLEPDLVMPRDQRLPSEDFSAFAGSLQDYSEEIPNSDGNASPDESTQDHSEEKKDGEGANSSWFKFMRSKGSSRQVSRLASASLASPAVVDDEAFANDLMDRLTNPTSSFEEKIGDEVEPQINSGWLEEVAAKAPIDSSCIGSSSWFGYPSAPEENPSTEPIVGGENFSSPVPLAAPGAPVDADPNAVSDDDHAITDFVYGFEKSLGFLKE